jgi:TonB family protein
MRKSKQKKYFHRIKTIVIAGVVFLLLINGNAVVAQTKGKRKATTPKVSITPPQPKVSVATVEKTESKPPIQPQYSTQAFDLSATLLPNNYLGHNVIDIYKRLDELQKTSQKGEFETTEAFQKRITAEASKPLVASLTRNSIFAFVIGKPDTKYDADQQLMSVNQKLSSVKNAAESLDDKRMSLNWGIVSRDISSYTGSNAYGAQVEVKRSLAEFYTLAFANYEQFPIVQYLTEIEQETAATIKKMWERAGLTKPKEDIKKNAAFSTNIKMDVQKAIKAKENIKILIVCRLTEPYAFEGSMYKKPTINSPQESAFLFKNLNVELLEIWFFDSSTGEIYVKQRPHNSIAKATPQVDLLTPQPTPEPTPQPTPRIISKGVINGSAIQLTKAVSPAAAKAVKANGAVNVKVELDERGNVVSASAISGHPLLQAAAVAAARQCKFAPTVLSGVAVRVTGIIVFVFP